MLTNFHTHHHFCRHATGNVEDYVLKAIKEHYDVIGISDHAPIPKYFNDRMRKKELPIYLDEIKQCKKKYGKQIAIKSGLEIEYFSELMDYYHQLKEKVDYLILTAHEYIFHGNKYNGFFIKNDKMLTGYFETLLKGIKTNLFSFIAHPDLFAFSYHFNSLAERYTVKLAKVCLEKDFVLEFNANGFRKGKTKIHHEYRYPYPYQPFWEIMSQYQVKVIVNSDCHHPSLLNDKFEKFARKEAKKLKLNIIDTIF